MQYVNNDPRRTARILERAIKPKWTAAKDPLPPFMKCEFPSGLLPPGGPQHQQTERRSILASASSLKTKRGFAGSITTRPSRRLIVHAKALGEAARPALFRPGVGIETPGAQLADSHWRSGLPGFLARLPL